MTRRFAVIAAALAVNLFFHSSGVFAQGKPVPLDAPAAPVFCSGGILLTDQTGDAIYRLSERGIEPVLRAPGCGRYFSLDPGRERLGVKYVNGEGLQIPAILDAGSVLPLAMPAPRAGEVSFSSGGAVAFTLDNLLIVRDQSGERTYDLGTYANLAPISPDGKHVAFNDARDRIWMLDLDTGGKTELSPESPGCFGPQWAPGSRRLFFSRLDGQGVIVDLASKKHFALGETLGPAWAPDGQTLVFYRREIEDGQLRNSDLYACKYDGTGLVRLTNTPDVCEMDPAFSPDGGTLLYDTYDRSTICTQPFSPAGASSTSARRETRVRLSPSPNGLRAPGSLQLLDVPYVNQVYDTADWFNGHAACGPTTAIMVLAYYNLLPEWDLRCSWPSSHVTHWGQYVSERYYFRQTDYALTANDPNGRPASGGYGYMWTGTSSPYSTMASYYAKHGLSAVCRDSSALQHADVVAEISAGPLSICNGLTTAGHIVLAHGLGDESHTFVVNDPYGDKNRTDLGYPNTMGKNARYDWPGYNNGNKNFNRIYWHVSAVNAPRAERDTIVDDLDFQRGFVMALQPPASFLAWKDLNRGFRGHMWWTKTKSGGAPDTCYAVWTPNLPADGFYEVFAYIPYSNATAAEYRISCLDGEQTFVLDQKALKDTWGSLGTYRMAGGSGSQVRLGDQSTIGGQEMIFDAIRWSYRGPLEDVRVLRQGLLPRTLALTNYPNPFNPVTHLRCVLPEAAMVRLDIVNLLGQRVVVAFEGWLGPGDHDIPWDGTGCSTGFYVARLRATGGNGGHVSTATRGIILSR